MTDAAAATSSSYAAPSITNHVLRIPHPQYATFVTQIVHLRSPTSSSSSSDAATAPNVGSSLFVHCTSISPTHAASLLPSPTGASSSTNTELSAEDEAIEADLQAALLAAGRSSSTHPSPPTAPLGSLAADFALAMSPSPSSFSTTSFRREPTGTPISSTSTTSLTSSLATSMSKRIAFKLSIPQLLLSLDLPHSLLPSPGRVQSPQDSRALLALEKAIRDACASVLNSSPHSAA